MAIDFGKMLKRNAAKLASENQPAEPSVEEKVKPVSKQAEEKSAPSEPVEASESEKKRSANRTRNKTLNLRFSPEELDEINDKIALSKLNKTDFILECVRDHDVIVVEELSEALTEFRKQGINLNQIATALNRYALELKNTGVRIPNENATWQTLLDEVIALRIENQKALELLNFILETVKRR